MYQPNPPQLPPGWIALWDETSQRYYYVEQATGTTQWDIPTGAPSAEANRGGGEASSYGSGYPPQPQQQNYPTYPSQQQTLPQPGESSGYNGSPSNSPAYPNQQPYGEQQQHQQQQQQPGMPGEGGPEGERGLGKMITSFPGGAITGSLIGYAAGKYLGGNKPSHQQSSGGLGAIGNFFQHQQPPQQQYGGYGNYGPPQGGFPGYNPPPPSNYGGGYAKPPKKFGFF